MDILVFFKNIGLSACPLINSFLVAHVVNLQQFQQGQTSGVQL